MTIIDGSFEAACRQMLAKWADRPVPASAVVSVEVEGGGEVQIGDMTWDTEPHVFVVEAYVPGGGSKQPRFRREFHSLPELWEALT